MTIRTLLVEDEPVAAARLRKLLHDEPDIEVVGEARDAVTAVELATLLAPDAIFVDIAIPNGNGIDLIRTLSPRPAIIFTTAYPEFAVDAFDVNAVDYLVKPISAERLSRAVSRLRQMIVRGDAGVQQQQHRVRYPERIAVRSRAEVIFLEVPEIYWIGAEGNYSRIHTREKSYLMREMIQSIAERLDPEIFVRVHRSAIINIHHVRKWISTRDEGSSVVLTNGASVRVATSYRESLERILGGPF